MLRHLDQRHTHCKAGRNASDQWMQRSSSSKLSAITLNHVSLDFAGIALLRETYIKALGGGVDLQSTCLAKE